MNVHEERLTWFIVFIRVPISLLESTKFGVVMIDELVEDVGGVVWGQLCSVAADDRKRGVWRRHLRN